MREQTIWQFVIEKKKTNGVSPVIDNEFRHNIVKVAVDRFGYRLVDPQLLWQCYNEIHDQQQDRCMKNWRHFVK